MVVAYDLGRMVVGTVRSPGPTPWPHKKTRRCRDERPLDPAARPLGPRKGNVETYIGRSCSLVGEAMRQWQPSHPFSLC